MKAVFSVIKEVCESVNYDFRMINTRYFRHTKDEENAFLLFEQLTGESWIELVVNLRDGLDSVPYCKTCGSVSSFYTKKYGKFCCSSCATAYGREKYKSEKHLRDQKKRRIKEEEKARKDEEKKKRREERERNKPPKRPKGMTNVEWYGEEKARELAENRSKFQSGKKRPNQSKKLKEWYSNEENKKKFLKAYRSIDYSSSWKEHSIRMKEKIRNGDFTPPTNIKSRRFDYEGISFRSTFEVIYYVYHTKILSNDVAYETIRLPYKDESGNDRIYIVDFENVTTKELIEIKPESNVNTIKHKAEAAQKYCKESGKTFLVVTEETLKQYLNDIVKSGYTDETISEIAKRYKKWIQ